MKMTICMEERREFSVLNNDFELGGGSYSNNIDDFEMKIFGEPQMEEMDLASSTTRQQSYPNFLNNR